ncbi:MAG: hypothetical protein LBL66_06820 [Clostridiales bacterium]|jgi:hypothetical protein|nr:hypothetical protein [Clostridiales bacterium]
MEELKSGIFTLKSVSVTEIGEDSKWAKAAYKLIASGAAGEVLLTDRTRLKPSRKRDVLHGYVVRNDRRAFEIFYDLTTKEISACICK